MHAAPARRASRNQRLTGTFGILAALCGIFAGLASHSRTWVGLWTAIFLFWVTLLIIANRRWQPGGAP